MDNSAVILAELQSLRTDFNNYAREAGERLAGLETGMKSLVGNGQPGRVGKLESDVAKLQRYQWWLAGVGAGVVGLLDLALRLFRH